MIFKLSLRNAIRSFRDYLVYFLTLTIVVSLFYVFRSIEFQPFIQQLSPESIEEVLSSLSRINVIMIFVVTAFVLYANSFLLKRRSKELGIYMTVGISSLQINLMLFIEVMLIGIIAIFAGVVFGVFLSTLIGLLITRMLGAIGASTPFIFEITAAFKTSYVFLLIFLGSSLFNYLRIARLKIVNLLNSFGKLKHLKKGNQQAFIFSVIVTSVSIGLLVYSYYVFVIHGIDFSKDNILNAVYLLGIGFVGLIAAGTYLLSYIVNKSDRVKYKGINLYTFKKVTDKIIQNGLVIGTIALIISVTLVSVGIGFSYNSWIHKSLLDKAPYTISVSELPTNNELADFLPYFNNKGYTVKDAFEFNIYTTDLLQKNIVDMSLINRFEDEVDLRSSLNLMSLSTYNKIREIIGEKPISLNDREVAINTKDMFKEAVLSYIKEAKEIKLNNKVLIASPQLVYDSAIADSFYVTGGKINLVVPDQFLNSNAFDTIKSFIVNTTNRVSLDDSKEFRDFMFSKTGGFVMVSQAETIEFSLKRATDVITSSLFLGFILMIIGLSILSLHQMTDAIESKKHYNILSKLGVSGFGLRICVLKQIFTYFMVPLLIATPNFIVGIMVVSKWFGIAGAFSVSTVVVSTMGIILSIYAFFIMITYNSCANILELS